MTLAQLASGAFDKLLIRMSTKRKREATLDEQRKKYLDRLKSDAESDDRKVTYFGQFSYCFKYYGGAVPSNITTHNIPFVIGQTEEEISLLSKEVLRGRTYDTLAYRDESGEKKTLGFASIEGVITPDKIEFLKQYGEHDLTKINLDKKYSVKSIISITYDPRWIISDVNGFEGTSNDISLTYSGNWKLFRQGEEGILLGGSELPFSMIRINPPKGK